LYFKENLMKIQILQKKMKLPRKRRELKIQVNQKSE